MKRKTVKPSKDKAVFKKTAGTTKSINLSPTTYRGGIRL